MAIRGIIFDYGGVILDMRWDIARELALEHGLAERAVVETLYANKTWQQLELGVGDRDAWLSEAHTALETIAGKEMPPLHEHWRERQHLIAANIDLMGRLRPAYKTALLSNADSALRRQLTEFDVLRLFDDVVVSAEVGLAKPQTEIYALSAQRIGLAPEECVFIDDLEPNVQGARDAGMRGVHFRIDLGHDLAAQLADVGVKLSQRAR